MEPNRNVPTVSRAAVNLVHVLAYLAEGQESMAVDLARSVRNDLDHFIRSSTGPDATSR